MRDIELNYTLLELADMENIADIMEEEDLNRIGTTVVEEYKQDKESRRDYMKRNEEYLKLAAQIKEKKTHPWVGAANVKYPMLTTASIQFAAHAYPALLTGNKLVKAKHIGADPEGEKADAAARIENHMSYQLLSEMLEWEEDMDKLTIILPIIGCLFKKSYYSHLDLRNKSDLILPKDLVVNYYASNIETAIRKTHRIELTNNDIFERVQAGLFLDVNLGTVNPHLVNQDKEASDKIQGAVAPNDKPANTPRSFLEQHRFWDLDNDGYEEPYVMTVDEQTGKVVRIVARYDDEAILYGEDETTLIKINPIEYFTKFGFIPNPDGGIYDLGFGLLLGSLNETANTLINQLLDGGTLSNMQSGFISRGIKFKKGKKRFTPGEWKTVNSSGEDMQKGIVPLPVREPSQVLFLLLGTILEAGEKLSSVKDILVGENPGQNQPATTTLAMLEQGLKVYTAIYKRIHKSLGREFEKLFYLNKHYLDQEAYFEMLDDDTLPAAKIAREDYWFENAKIKPYSDPKVSSDALRKAKANALLELLPLGLNPDEVKRRVLESQEQPNIKALLDYTPPEDPEYTKWKLEFKQKAEYEEEDLNIKRMVAESKATADEAKALLIGVQAYVAQMDTIRNDMEAFMAPIKEAATTTEKDKT